MLNLFYFQRWIKLKAKWRHRLVWSVSPLALEKLLLPIVWPIFGCRRIRVFRVSIRVHTSSASLGKCLSSETKKMEKRLWPVDSIMMWFATDWKQWEKFRRRNESEIRKRMTFICTKNELLSFDFKLIYLFQASFSCPTRDSIRFEYLRCSKTVNYLMDSTKKLLISLSRKRNILIVTRWCRNGGEDHISTLVHTNHEILMRVVCLWLFHLPNNIHFFLSLNVR